MQIKILPLMVTAVLTGCSMAPDYQRPETPTTAGWDGVAQQANETALPDWKTFMADENLQSLVEMALDNNKDLRQTVLNVASLRAQYKIQDSARYPGLNATGSVTNQRYSENYNGSKTYTHYKTATVGVSSYELDLFGRVKSLSDEALESYFAQDETRRSAVIALVAEVATSYMTLLADEQLLSLTDETVKAYEETLKLVQTRYDAGYSDALTLAQSKTALYSAQATAATYRLAVAQQHNTLRQLVGAPIKQNIAGQLPQEEGAFLSELKVGASSELLLSRPDILAAEHTLKADNANIGAARAAFFPTISLTTGFGSASSSLDNLFSAGSQHWSFIPSLSLPIFDWGSNSANLDMAKIQKQSSIIAYQQTIETAFKEVSDALLGQKYYLEEWDAQQANLAANEQYYDLAKMRYEKGNDSYMDLLDAQRSLFSARESELTSHLSLLTSRIDLFKALGGGWTAADHEKATSVQNALDKMNSQEEPNE